MPAIVPMVVELVVYCRFRAAGGVMDNNDNENDNDGDDVVIVQPPQSRPHQPQQSRQHQPQAQPKPVAAQAPAPAPQSEVIDGTGPQPEIEGIPAEVAMVGNYYGVAQTRG